MIEKFQAKEELKKDKAPEKTAEDVVAKMIPKGEDKKKVIATMTIRLIGSKGKRVEVEVDNPNTFTAGRFMLHERRIVMALNKLRAASRLAARKNKGK